MRPAFAKSAADVDVAPRVAHAAADFFDPLVGRGDFPIGDQEVAFHLREVAHAAMADAQAGAVRQEQVFPLVYRGAEIVGRIDRREEIPRE